MNNVRISFLIFLLIQLIDLNWALVPEVCASNVTFHSGICCPIPNGFDEPCGGKGRGTCQHISIHREISLMSALKKDDRVNWPSRFFTKMCSCEGNFFGVACEKCWYGWEGKNCDIKRKVVRRNIWTFTKKEIDMFIKILAISNKIPSEFMILVEKDSLHSDPLRDPKFIRGTFQQYIAFVHRYASRSTLFRSDQMCQYFGYLDYNHNTVSFATWHRSLMLFWERKLAEIAMKEFGWKDFAIPYWDWVDNKECEVCKDFLMGSTGEYDETRDIYRLSKHSHFYNWTEYCTPPKTLNRCFGCHFTKEFLPLHRKYLDNTFPTTEDLIFTLKHSTWHLPDEKQNQEKSCRSFHLALEGFCGRPDDESDYLYMHNKVHNMVQGSMCCAATASNDPLFILHHSFIDKILECWFDLYSPSPTHLPNHGIEIGNCRECFAVGQFPLVRHSQVFMKMENFGITYDNFNFGKQKFNCKRDAKTILKHKID